MIGSSAILEVKHQFWGIGLSQYYRSNCSATGLGVKRFLITVQRGYQVKGLSDTRDRTENSHMQDRCSLFCTTLKPVNCL